VRIVREAVSDECLGSGLIREVVLDQKIGRDFMEYLSLFGRVDLQEGDRAFFQADVEYLFTLKGILSDDRLRITYRKGKLEAASRLFREMTESFGQKERVDDLLRQRDLAIKS
jgi:hypothetical protein